MTIENTRLENARQLATEIGGIPRFAEIMGWSNRQLGHNYVGTNPSKRIGTKVARRIEVTFKKPVGWLDERHALDTPLRSGAATIPGLDLAGILGPGPLRMLQLDSKLHQLTVSTTWLKRHLGSRPAEHLAIATVTGSSMGEDLPDGALVIIDRSDSAAREDGTYLLGRQDTQEPGIWFRHVARQPDGTVRISTAHQGDQSTHKSLAKAGIVVLGRVVAKLELTKV